MMSGASLHPEASPFAVRAKSLYFEAHTVWAAGLHPKGCFYCAIPSQRVETEAGAIDLSGPVLRGGCPLPHVIGMRLAVAFAAFPPRRDWMRVALVRRVWRLFLEEYALPPEPEWLPSEDDPNAWTCDPQVSSETQRQLDEWGVSNA